MIPLSYFLIAWVILLAIFGVLMVLTLVQLLRFGLASPSTYMSTLVFLVVTTGVVLYTLTSFARVDWSTPISLMPAGVESLFGIPEPNETL
jgi:hypothetical protein